MFHRAYGRVDFRAMGTDCSIQVWGDNAQAIAALGQVRVDILEARWSRFRPSSELSVLNARAGQGPIGVSEDTELLIRAMRDGWQATDGAFDPTIGLSLIAHGYDADFPMLSTRKAWEWVAPQPAHGMGDVAIGNGSVNLPIGIALDPGAIGKGLAADLVVDELMGAGVDGVLVDLGGDIAHAGVNSDEVWVLAIRDERNSTSTTESHSISTEHRGLATSTTLKRRWAGTRHHVLDPRTGTMVDEHLVQVSVCAARASIAEIWATALLVRPELLSSAPPNMQVLALSSQDVIRNDFSSIPERTVA